MKKYTGEMADPFGRRKYFDRIGSVKKFPVIITTDQNEKGVYTGTIAGKQYTEFVLGIEEALDPKQPKREHLGFDSQDELLAAIGRRGVTVLEEIIEQTEELTQV